MNWIPPSIPHLLAQVVSETKPDYFPLRYQIACIVLTALFVWIFCIARNPRGWRRLFQAKFCNPENHSVNRNKRLDELIRRYGIILAMVVLVADVSCIVWGVTTQHRNAEQSAMSREDRFRSEEAARIQERASKTSARRAVGG